MERLDQLEEYFKNKALPDTTIEISKCEKVIDLNKFVDTHLSVIGSNIHNMKLILPYIERLEKLKQQLEK